jgi:hypothetical protein
MFIDINSVLINSIVTIQGTTVTYSPAIKLAEYITECKFGYHKVWSDDTGRNMAFKMSGTLGGIFPKITPHFRKLSKEELNIIAPILNSANQSITYYDPDLNTNHTMTSYAGDWELSNRRLNYNEGFDCAFIDTEPRD